MACDRRFTGFLLTTVDIVKKRLSLHLEQLSISPEKQLGGIIQLDLTFSYTLVPM